MGDIMLVSEHKRILSSAQERYDAIVSQTKWAHRVTGFILGCAFGILATAVAFCVLISD